MESHNKILENSRVHSYPSAWGSEYSASDSKASSYFHPSAWGPEYSASDSEASDTAHVHWTRRPENPAIRKPTVRVAASRAGARQRSKKGSTDSTREEIQVLGHQLLQKMDQLVKESIEEAVQQLKKVVFDLSDEESS